MKLSRWWPLLAVPLALAACGMNDTEAEEDDPTDGAAADSVATTGTVTAPPAAIVTTPPADSAMAGASTAGTGVTLNPVGGSGVSGDMSATASGGGVTVMVSLRGAKGAGTHQGHVHTGTCDALGGVVAPLQPVTTDAGGSGSSTSTVSVPVATLMNGQHVVSYHEAGGNPGKSVACGAIPMSHSSM